MEINLYINEWEDKPDTGAVLFDKERRELAYSEMEDEYFIDWIFDDINGDNYIARVESKD